MSKIIKWATYVNATDTATLKQHAFHSVVKKARITGDEYTVAQSLCGRVMVGEGDTLQEASTIEQINDEVINLQTACKICQKLFNAKHTTNAD